MVARTETRSMNENKEKEDTGELKTPGPNWCPVYRPTKQEFELPFTEYVDKIFSKQPDLPMFKVIPPPGWRPRKSPFPDLKTINIPTAIRQNAFGTRGAYRYGMV